MPTLSTAENGDRQTASSRRLKLQEPFAAQKATDQPGKRMPGDNSLLHSAASRWCHEGSWPVLQTRPGSLPWHGAAEQGGSARAGVYSATSILQKKARPSEADRLEGLTLADYVVGCLGLLAHSLR